MLEKRELSTNISGISKDPDSIAQVYVFLPFREFFDYKIPIEMQGLTILGCRVKVPFGTRKITGVVHNTAKSSSLDQSKIKNIIEIIDPYPLLSNNLSEIIKRFSRYYYYYPGEVFQSCLSPELRTGSASQEYKKSFWVLTNKGSLIDIQELKRSNKQQEIVLQLREIDRIECNSQQTKGLSSQIKSLESKGMIEKVYIKTSNSLSQKSINTPSNINLNSEQIRAIESISLASDHFKAFLLFGITGSGKTEVYLNCCIDIIKSNKQVLVMVPEISLTPQTIARYEDRFNGYKISSWHSNQTNKEKNIAWQDIYNGHTDVIIGTRSSVWLPYKDLGMIIVDEEHDSSFKQQEGFLYNARDVAVSRAKIENCPIILGSATPSLETLYNVKLNKYHEIVLSQRANQISQQEIKLIDVRHNKLKSGISYDLIQIIRDKIENQEQVLIFLNRRGFAPAIYCNSCQWLAQCKYCKVNLIFHKENESLVCHRCFYRKKMPESCPSCESYNVFPVGVGTEQIEYELGKLFTSAHITRIDKDTTSTNKKLQSLLSDVSTNKTDIVVGTQMIAKGHDFSNLTMAIIIDIDQAFFSSDYRAIEKAAQLVTQVAGRVGRGTKQGLVYLQTNQPENPFFTYLTKLDYHSTGNKILSERVEAYLPPRTFQALINASSKDNKVLKQFMRSMADKLRLIINSCESIEVWGPVSSPITKIRNRHRQQILIQSHSRRELHETLGTFVSNHTNDRRIKDIRWSIDIDPQDFC